LEERCKGARLTAYVNFYEEPPTEGRKEGEIIAKKPNKSQILKKKEKESKRRFFEAKNRAD